MFQKTLAINDFYFGSSDFAYPMGHISFVGKLDAVALSAGAPALVPGITLDIMARHSLDFWLTSEDLPDPENRVTLDGEGNIVLSYTPEQSRGPHAAHREAGGPGAAFGLRTTPFAAQPVCRSAHSACRCRPSERHDSIRARSEDVSSRQQL